MRRRLWNTILEITLQSSLTSGGPPFVSLDDFDTEPPGNFDDDQLLAEDQEPKPDDEFTQVSVAIALRKTFPARLAVTKFLNEVVVHGTYEATLQLDAGLRASFKALCRTLQGYNSSITPSLSRFTERIVDFLMHRYLLSLHIPFFGPALHETAYAFSRKVVLETSLKVWCAAYPSSEIMAARSRSSTDTVPSDRDDFVRLTTLGSGPLRTAAFQAALFIAAELRTQLQEDDSLGPVPLRQDLFSVLEDAKTWCIRCIELGETNVKGYMFLSLVVAYMRGLMQGLPKDEFPNLLVRTAEESEATFLPVLEGMATYGQAEGALAGLDQIDWNPSPDVMEDWDFMVSSGLSPRRLSPYRLPTYRSPQMTDAMLDFGMAEPLNWAAP
jgi:hypothetical protein